MIRRELRWLSVLVTGMVPLLPGGLNGQPPKPVSGAEAKRIEALLATAKTPAKINESIRARDACVQGDTPEGGRVTRQTIEQARPVDQLASYDANPAVLWPGSLVQGSSIPAGTLAGANLNRTGAYLTITGVRATPKSARTPETTPPKSDPVPRTTISVSIATPDAVDSARMLLTHQPSIEPIATWAYKEHVFSSFEELAFRLDLKASWLGGEMRAGLFSESYSENNNVAIEFSQQFYTIASRDFAPATSAFSNQAKASDLARYVGESNPLTYVSSVTYGRKAFLVLSSRMEMNALRQYAKLAADYMVGSIGLDQEAKVRRILSQVDTKIWFYGGPVTTTDVIQAKDRVEAFKKALAAAPAQLITSGKPISYRLNYLLDGKPAALNLATDFTITKYASGGDLISRIDFLTGDQDKDPDTRIQAWIAFANPAGFPPPNPVASFEYPGGPRWAPGVTDGFDLVSVKPFTWSQIPALALILRIVPNGSDNWKFTPTVSITTSTGVRHQFSPGAQEYESIFKPMLGIFAWMIPPPPKLPAPACPVPDAKPFTFQ